jgi:hypothetical protein
MAPLAALLVPILCASSARASASDSFVRPSGERLQRAVAAAAQGSVTFRQLAQTLQAQQVIVYILPGSCEFKRREACLRHTVVVAGSYRILQVMVRDDLPVVRLAGVIAHELQHAAEIGASRAVSADEIGDLFRRIGRPCDRQHLRSCFETDAAIDVEHRVVSELTAGRRIPGAR